jgi:hypothetical protein
MKKILLLSFAALLLTGNCHAQVKTPPHAASTKTWTFGEYIWSDAIQMPRCDHVRVGGCRIYKYGNSTWYYYRMHYVWNQRDAMCPEPWRLPNSCDAVALTGASEPTMQTLINEWGLPGVSWARTNHMQSVGYIAYWSLGSGYGSAHVALVYSDHGLIGLTTMQTNNDIPVRCVLDKKSAS